jgi:hypothetical protein
MFETQESQGALGFFLWPAKHDGVKYKEQVMKDIIGEDGQYLLEAEADYSTGRFITGFGVLVVCALFLGVLWMTGAIIFGLAMHHPLVLLGLAALAALCYGIGYVVEEQHDG